MFAPISLSMGNALDRAAKLIRLLEQAGMTDEDVQTFIDMQPHLRPRVIESWRQSMIDFPRIIPIPDHPHPDGLRNLFGCYAFRGSPPFDEGWDADDLIQRYGSRSGLQEMFAEVSERDITAAILYYGLHDGRHRTFKEVGDYFGISATRARDLENRAVRAARRVEFKRRALEVQEWQHAWQQQLEAS